MNRNRTVALTLATLSLLTFASGGCRTAPSDANATVAAPAVVSTADTPLEPGITFREVDQPNAVGTTTHL